MKKLTKVIMGLVTTFALVIAVGFAVGCKKQVVPARPQPPVDFGTPIAINVNEVKSIAVNTGLSDYYSFEIKTEGKYSISFSNFNSEVKVTLYNSDRKNIDHNNSGSNGSIVYCYYYAFELKAGTYYFKMDNKSGSSFNTGILIEQSSGNSNSYLFDGLLDSSSLENVASFDTSERKWYFVQADQTMNIGWRVDLDVADSAKVNIYDRYLNKLDNKLSGSRLCEAGEVLVVQIEGEGATGNITFVNADNVADKEIEFNNNTLVETELGAGERVVYLPTDNSQKYVMNLIDGILDNIVIEIYNNEELLPSNVEYGEICKFIVLDNWYNKIVIQNNGDEAVKLKWMMEAQIENTHADSGYLYETKICNNGEKNFIEVWGSGWFAFNSQNEAAINFTIDLGSGYAEIQVFDETFNMIDNVNNSYHSCDYSSVSRIYVYVMVGNGIVTGNLTFTQDGAF